MTTFRRATVLVLALILTALGCSSTYVTAIRTGGAYLSRGEGCSISFENLNYQEAAAQYESIGLITLSGTSELTEEGKKDVELEACKMGAHVLTLNASASMGGSGVIQFLVLRKPDGATP